MSSLQIYCMNLLAVLSVTACLFFCAWSACCFFTSEMYAVIVESCELILVFSLVEVCLITQSNYDANWQLSGCDDARYRYYIAW